MMIAGALLGAFTILDEIADAASLARHAANNPLTLKSSSNSGQ
jgi:hypothetical protein